MNFGFLFWSLLLPDFYISSFSDSAEMATLSVSAAPGTTLSKSLALSRTARAPLKETLKTSPKLPEHCRRGPLWVTCREEVRRHPSTASQCTDSRHKTGHTFRSRLASPVYASVHRSQEYRLLPCPATIITRWAASTLTWKICNLLNYLVELRNLIVNFTTSSGNTAMERGQSRALSPSMTVALSCPTVRTWQTFISCLIRLELLECQLRTFAAIMPMWHCKLEGKI